MRMGLAPSTGISTTRDSTSMGNAGRLPNFVLPSGAVSKTISTRCSAPEASAKIPMRREPASPVSISPPPKASAARSCRARGESMFFSLASSFRIGRKASATLNPSTEIRRQPTRIPARAPGKPGVTRSTVGSPSTMAMSMPAMPGPSTFGPSTLGPSTLGPSIPGTSLGASAPDSPAFVAPTPLSAGVCALAPTSVDAPCVVAMFGVATSSDIASSVTAVMTSVFTSAPGIMVKWLCPSRASISLRISRSSAVVRALAARGRNSSRTAFQSTPLSVWS